MADETPEIMPRPPQSHWPGDEPRAAPTGILEVIAEQLRQVTELHEQFLNAQAKLHARLGVGGKAHSRTARTEVDIDTSNLDSAGRMIAGALIREVFALLPERDHGSIDCTLIFHNGLPGAGETLCSEMTVDGSSFHGGVDGRMSVRGAWSPHIEMGDPAPTLTGQRFTPDAVAAFALGHPADCFGPVLDRTRAHVRSPGIGPRRALLLHQVTALDPERGLHAEGHLPTWDLIPALIEGGLQAMAFQFTASGRTVDRDGWRFEPALDEPFRVRWQCAVPAGPPRYTVVVLSLTGDTLHADFVCTVDDRVVLRAERMAVRLVPDTPLPYWRLLGPPTVQRTGHPVPLSALGGLCGHHDPVPVATVGPIRYDHAAMLAAAWGPMREVFGDWGTRSDDTFRLPGPPFLFITRLVEMPGAPGKLEAGSGLIAEYDVPDEVWFTEQDTTIPIAVVMEIVLQPCGFLASFVGSAMTSRERLHIRNLDGCVTTRCEAPQDVRTFRTTVKLTGADRWDGTLLETFRIRCTAGGMPVLDGTTTIVLSPAAALIAQPGMPVTAADHDRLTEPCDRPVIDLRARPARYFGRSARLPGPMLLMIDRITGYWPDGGRMGLGRLRAESDVRADAWYFKAHFLTDPVQPGSLGVEAMSQLLRYHLIERGVGAGFRFEPEVPAKWSYRGQVLPTDKLLTIEIDVLDVVLTAGGGHAEAEAWLWVDGRRVYHVPRLRVRVVSGDTSAPAIVETVLDPACDTWLADHCPTWTVPALPLMSTADLLAKAAADYSGRDVRILHEVRLQRWLPVTSATRLRLTSHGDQVNLAVWHDAGSLSRFTPVATATVGFEPPPRPRRFAPLTDSRDAPCPYAEVDLFHGPSFHYLVSLRTGARGATGLLGVDQGSVPRGLLHQGLLDAALHVIPHNDLWRWDAGISRGTLAFPHRIARLALFEPLPDSGEVEVEARFAGVVPYDTQLAAVDVQLCAGNRVLVAFQVVNMLFPAGRLAGVSGRARRAYFRDRRPMPNLLLSTVDGQETVLRRDELDRIDVLTGTAAALYGLPTGTPTRDLLPLVAVKEHVARLAGVHPGTVVVDGPNTAHCLDVVHRLDITGDDDIARVRSSSG